MLMNPGSPALAGRPTLAARRCLRRMGEILNRWMELRRSRRDLAELDARLLRDIGVSGDEARREAVMPFWKPY